MESNIKQRLANIAQECYPIEPGMCAFRRQGQINKRVCFVWRMEKELNRLSDSQKQLVLNELEKKAGIQPGTPEDIKPMGE